MERLLGLLLACIGIIGCTMCSANVINDSELNILSSELSDRDCKKLLTVLYERRQSEPEMHPHRARYTGRCALDLEQWLDSEGKGSLPLTELDEALAEIGKPALGRQISNEVFSEKTHNLHNLFDPDGRLVVKDLLPRRHR
ncbi:uncharacterized protein LOC110987481 [Acanthaster planci]|uniref:Uncharacterized protein LOC110987481 n=1 Tax=Acanthaster planci TaxID=133434 RepID=A0A8B7ZK99_ACAPL|nr:uncharacterized protein LOC110987481 [Acanthaster planci]